METKTKQTEKNAVETTAKESNFDLLENLKKINVKNNIKKTTKNKIVYPENLKDLKSTDRAKKKYRNTVQDNMRYYLDQKEITKELKNEFVKFCKDYYNVQNFQTVDLASLYCYHDEANKIKANIVLTNYKNFK